MRLYKVTIRPVVTYAAKTMCMTKKYEEKLRVFKRGIVRKNRNERNGIVTYIGEKKL